MNSYTSDVLIKFNDTSRELEKLRVKILYEQSWPTQFTLVVVAILYVYLFRHKAAHAFLAGWASTLTLVITGRLILISRFYHLHVKLNRDFAPKKWENIFALSTFISGVLWGFAVCAAFPVGDLSADSVMGYILAGITAGAAVAYSTSLKATYSFFLPAVIPFAFRLAFKGDETYSGMAFMLFAYATLFLKLAHKFNQYAMGSITLSFHKDQLIDRIRLMQAHVTQSAQMAALGRMAGGMAHEINNPLSIIQGASGALELSIERGDLSSTAAAAPKHFDKINRSTERIAKIIKELRFFSGRPDGEPYEMSPVTAIIETAGNFCRERFKSHGILFSIGEISPDLVVECRPFHITQVILNLLNNSFDAVTGLDEKWVKFEAFDLGDNIELSIADSGSGISEEVRSKIMQPFFSTKETGKGMGLGLCVAKGIINSHGGDLWLDTGSPHTRFVLRLPKTKKLAPPAAA